jgi:hypothetical protein
MVAATSLLFKVARVVCPANAWLCGVESWMEESRCLDMAQPKDVVDCGHQSDQRVLFLGWDSVANEMLELTWRISIRLLSGPICN